MTEGPDAPLEPTCNVPRHPAIPPPPGAVICNVHYHPDYPTLMGTSSGKINDKYDIKHARGKMKNIELRWKAG